MYPPLILKPTERKRQLPSWLIDYSVVVVVMRLLFVDCTYLDVIMESDKQKHKASNYGLSDDGDDDDGDYQFEIG